MNKNEILEVLEGNDYFAVLEAIKEFAEATLDEGYADLDILKSNAGHSKMLLQIVWALQEVL